MCIAGPTIQANGTVAPSSITNKSPDTNPELWVKIAEASDGVTGYENINLSGSGLFLYVGQYGGTRYVNGFDTWTLSSFDMPSNIKMAIFSEVSYGGLYRILTQPTLNFQSLTTSGFSWNDNIRSIKIMYATENIGKPYEAYVYNSATDLAITANSVYTDANGKQRIRWVPSGGVYNVYDIVQHIGTGSLSNYILFGSGITDNSTVYQTLSGLASDETTPCYEFVVEGSISTDITKTFYIRNGKTEFDRLYSLMETIINSLTSPTQPSYLRFSSITKSAFTVSWRSGDGATSYTYTIDGEAATPSTDNGLASKSATFSGLTGGTTYNVVVTAVKNSTPSSSSSFAVTTVVAGAIMWEGGHNVTLSDPTNIQKTGGVDGNEDAGQSSYPIFIGTKFLQFSVTSLINASIGIGQSSVYNANDYRRVDGNLTFNFAYTLTSSGNIDTFNGLGNFSEGIGTYTSDTVFGMMKDLVNNQFVLYINNIEAKRYGFVGYGKAVDDNSLRYINISIRTAGGTINNIKLFDERPPAVPSSLTSNNINSSGFTVGWSGGDRATSYTYTIDGVAATPSADNGVASKSATFSGLTVDTTYSVTVTAVNASGTSTSNTLSVTTVATPPPSAITNMLSSSITTSGFTVGWNGGDGATSYTYTIDGVAATPSADNGIASKSATFDGFTGNDSYTVIITAVNSVGNTSSSAFSVYRVISLTNSGLVDTIIVKYNSDGTTQWARKIGGTSNDFVSNTILDASSNVYLIGSHRSPTITIYNADGTPFIALTNVGNTTQPGTATDTYIVKYDSYGTPLWARKIGGNGNDSPGKIKLDSSANLYISGIYTSNPVTIYNSDETAFTTLTNSGSNDIFLVKYNSEGIPQWARRAGGGDAEVSNNIILDNSNNIYMCGYYNSGYYGSNPFKVYNSDGSSFAELTTSGYSTSDSDVFIVKYNSDGIPQWLRRIGGSRTDRLVDMIFDSSYNIYITGTTGSSSLDIFNSDGSSFAQITNPGDNNFQYTFIVKYNSSGTPQWVTKIGISSYDSAVNIVSDFSENIYVSGNYSSNPLTIYNIDGTVFTTLINSGPTDIFIVKYNSDGTPLWARRIGGTGSDDTTYAVVDTSANIYISGNYSSNPLTIYNADETAFTTLTNSGSTDIFIMKYDSSGTPQWARNCHKGNIAKIVLDTSANIITYGYYQSNPLTIYNADGTSFTTLTNSGSNDIFIIKYDSSGAPLWARKISGNSNESQSDILVDSSENIYVSGTYNSNTLRISSS